MKDVPRHGEKMPTCSHEGCANLARGKKGVCVKHGAKNPNKKCSREGCTSQVVKGGVCRSHGAKAAI